MRRFNPGNTSFAGSLPAVALSAIALSACAATDAAPQRPSASQHVASPAQDAFFERLAARCGQAFAGQLASDPAADADMAGKDMIMHIRRCTPDRIEIPFHIGGQASGDGWDRSRTWIVTRTEQGLRLKHDHRHADGSADPVTLYGGDTADSGVATRQAFPVDHESIRMFEANGLSASVTNIWHIAIDDAGYTYGLSRPGRDFRVYFDFANPVAPPHAPWGWE